MSRALDFPVHRLGSDALTLAVNDQGRWVAVASLAVAFRLNAEELWARICRDENINRDVLTSTSGKRLAFIAVESIPWWLATHVRTDSLPAELREKHRLYVREAVRALTDHFTKGVSTNEAVIGPQAAEQIRAMATQARADYLRELRQAAEMLGRLDPHDEVARVAAASALKSQLMLAAGQTVGAELPVTVACRAQELGLRLTPGETSTLGGLVHARYRERTGREAPTTPQVINGRQTPVRVYRQADLTWIDPIVREFAARKREFC